MALVEIPNFETSDVVPVLFGMIRVLSGIVRSQTKRLQSKDE